MSDVAIHVEGLGKQYHIGRLQKRGGYKTIRETVVDVCAAPFRRIGQLVRGHHSAADLDATMWALRDVSFEIKQGEVVGIIGNNGAGKSTLLKILSRITGPTSGYADVVGRVGSLLEVGTGFHPELTGRENIYLNGAILGMRKVEINRKFDEIVDFSDLEDFLDTPVKHFSSGMYVRLAFAVAAHLDPEIMLVDEVLAVGDVAFQRKCLGKMDEVAKGGRTVILVSHNMGAIENLCNRGLVIYKGVLDFDGPVSGAIERYLKSSTGESGGRDSHVVDLLSLPRAPWCRRLLQKIEFYSGGKPVNSSVPIGAPLELRVHFRLEKPMQRFDVGLGFNNLFNQRVLTAHSLFKPNRDLGVYVGDQVFACRIPSLPLVPGEYKIKVALDISNEEVDAIDDAARLWVVSSDYYGSGRVPWNGICVTPQEWVLESGQN
jgi:lipopolysaccharide transport system ATP-binding protein